MTGKKIIGLNWLALSMLIGINKKNQGRGTKIVKIVYADGLAATCAAILAKLTRLASSAVCNTNKHTIYYFTKAAWDRST